MRYASKRLIRFAWFGKAKCSWIADRYSENTFNSRRNFSN